MSVNTVNNTIHFNIANLPEFDLEVLNLDPNAKGYIGEQTEARLRCKNNEDLNKVSDFAEDKFGSFLAVDRDDSNSLPLKEKTSQIFRMYGLGLPKIEKIITALKKLELANARESKERDAKGNTFKSIIHFNIPGLPEFDLDVLHLDPNDKNYYGKQTDARLLCKTNADLKKVSDFAEAKFGSFLAIDRDDSNSLPLKEKTSQIFRMCGLERPSIAKIINKFKELEKQKLQEVVKGPTGLNPVILQDLVEDGLVLINKKEEKKS